MKLRVVLLAWLLSLPLTAHGHTEIFFPKLFSAAELPTTGFVLLNPDPFTATVTVVLFGADGSISSKGDLTIPAGGQLARLGSELFPGATKAGWVWVINDTEGMQAFWLSYDAGITFLDGAEALSYDGIGPDQIIALVAGQVELNVINPGVPRVPLTIRLFGDNGVLAPPVSRELPTAGGIQEDVSSLFPAVDMTQARFIRIQTTGAAIASSAVIRGFLVEKESAVINGVNVGLRSEMTFPHVINGARTGADYTTVIGVTNLSASSQTVRFIFNPEIGDPIELPPRTIAGNGALRETAQSLFSLSPEFQAGWVRVIGTAALTGFAGYADTVAGGLAVVPPGAPQTKLFFAHIANGPPQWQTGIALLNPGATPADIEIYAMTPSGSLIGKAALSLEPGGRTAKVIHELIPETLGVNSGFVYVRTANNVPLFGIELFYTRDLAVLSNVAAGKLVSGVLYVPPPM